MLTVRDENGREYAFHGFGPLEPHDAVLEFTGTGRGVTIGPCGSRSMGWKLTPLPVATTIPRSEFEREVRCGWTVKPALGSALLIRRIATNGDHDRDKLWGWPSKIASNDEMWLWRSQCKTCRRPGSDVDLEIVDDAKPEPAFPPAGTVMVSRINDVTTAVVTQVGVDYCIVGEVHFETATELFRCWRAK